MAIINCNSCGRTVLPGEDGKCPACLKSTERNERYEDLSIESALCTLSRSEKTTGPIELFGFLNPFLQFKKYMRTIKSVRNGDKLYEWLPEEIERKGLLSPWWANFWESFYASLPTLVVFKILEFFFDQKQTSQQLAGDMQRIVDLSDKFASFVTPFYLPFSIMVIGFLAGFASLHSFDCTKENRRKATNAFWYYDSAYNFFPEMMWSFFINLLLFSQTRKLPAESQQLFAFVAIIGIIISYIYNARFFGKEMIRYLFHLNMYSSDMPELSNRLQSDSGNKPKGPLLQYRVIVGVCGTSIVLLVSVIVGFICTFLASIMIQLKNLIQTNGV